MISLPNGGRVVESLDELPRFETIDTLYADFETTSGDPKKKATNPWHNCFSAGLAITVDDEPGAWYVPIAHHWGNNLPLEGVIDWWADIIDRSKRWANHNIKFDAHVSANSLGVLPECELICTLTLAKIIDSDRIKRGGYGLDVLSKDWLKEDISDVERMMAPYLMKNTDYGAVPIDIMAAYACQDVITNRRLHKYIEGNIPDQCRGVRDTEVALTTVLYEMERNGMRIDPIKLAVKELDIYRRLFEIDAELTQITGRSFRPHVNEDCYDILCNQFGLPVLGWTSEDEDGEPTDKSNPSFDKATLKQYLVHPYAPKRVVELMIEYRSLNTLNNFFVKRYQEVHVECLMHPSYNQAVRTFRMSCKDPNAQQLSPEAKQLILPNEGCSFISIDYSQIEFRFIVHYIQDQAAIDAYNANPDTDFHEWVATMCGIPRKPAKTTNFLIAFGGGKERLLGQLSQIMELVSDVKDQVDTLLKDGKIEEKDSLTVFNMLCRRRAEGVYDKYHDTLPGIKRTSRNAALAIKTRGYVFNIAGRRRQLPVNKAHIAFNSLNQSSAADLMKERMVAARNACRGTSIKIIASVHDEILFEAPTEIANDPRVQRDLVHIMEHTPFKIRVPIRCAIGVSDKDWYTAVKSAQALKYNEADFQNLEYLK